jgi:hypothetical protein
MASILAKIGAGTLLAGALFVGGAAPAFATEDHGDDSIEQVNESTTNQNANGNNGGKVTQESTTNQFNDIRAKLDALKGRKVFQGNSSTTNQNANNNNGADVTQKSETNQSNSIGE